MRKVPIVEQLQQTECGLCCAAMILGYYGCHARLIDLRQKYEIGRDGLRIREISELLKSYHMEVKIFKTAFQSLKTNNCPCIVFWEKKHYVVIEDIDLKRKKVVMADPATGRRTISYEEAVEGYSGYVILAMPSEGFKQIKKKRNVWFEYLYLLTKNKKLFLSILGLSVISYIFTLYMPIIIQQVIDFVNEGNAINSKDVLMWLYGVLIMSAIYILTVFLSGKKKISFAKLLDKEIGESLFSHMLKLPLKFFELRSHGDIIFRIQSLAIIRDTFTQRIITFLINCGTLIVLQVYLIVVSPKIAAVALIFAVLCGISIMYTRRKILETNQAEISTASKLQTIQSELVHSITNIKISGTEDDIYNKWKEQFNKNLDRHVDTTESSNVHSTFIASFNQIVPILILMLSMFFYVNGEITIGEVIALYSAGNTFMAVCVQIFSSMDDFLLSSQYLERVHEIIEEREEDYLSEGKEIKCNGSIELQNVSFAFTNHSEPVLKDISMKIKPNQKIAIVGASGSGKSTLGKVLLGIYAPTKGKLIYNSSEFNELNKKSLRKQMGVVPQDVILLNDTIYSNIEMSRDNITSDMIKHAADIAQVSGEIEEMPMKYNTIISDMGTNISGGQRQRIGFARAIVNNPNILLLDEATSSLDTINESRIADYLKSVGCTRIVIAHRISTIVDADVIYVMKDGKIVEQGNHEFLMKKNGVYTQLYNNQIIEGSKAAV